MPDNMIEFGVLNIVAHPHGADTYRLLLDRAANREVNFWGDLKAAIRPPREVERGIFQAEIIIGTEINLEEPLIDRNSFTEVTPEAADVVISEKHLYNGRVFLYTFVEENHLLFFQSKNEFGKRLSPSRAQKIFSSLFSVHLLGSDSPYVDVTVIPEDDTLDYLIGLPKLDRVEIHLQRPNPADVNDDEVQKILEELENQKAKSQTTTVSRAPGAKRIELNSANWLLARVAQFNGFVSAKGVTEEGESFSGSTKSYPKIIRRTVDVATAATAVALRVAKQFRIDQSPSPNGD